MSGQHAFLPPSSAAAWVLCAAWPTMNRLYPQEDTEDTLAGTASHWAFEQTFYARPVALGLVAPNGVTLSQEMLDGGAMFVEVVDRDLAESGLDRRYLNVEQRVYMPNIHAENWGTPDVWYFDQARMLLRVYDYKFGHGFVDAYMNWQCVDYLAGIIDKLAAFLQTTPAELDQRLRVEVIVVQPRNYDREGPVRRWPTVASDMRAMHNKLAGAAERAMDPKPVATPGSEQCEHCPGRHACTALQRQGYRAKHLSLQSVPVIMSPAALAVEHAMLEEAEALLKARREGLGLQITAHLKRGDVVPGYMLEATLGREVFSKPAGEVIALGQVLGVDLAKPQEALTPKQALAKGFPESLIKAWTMAPQRGLRLVRDTGIQASKVFR